MADEQASPSDRTADEIGPPKPPAGFGSLARRITTWTTNSLFSVIVIVVGLGFGRQVVRWWAEDRPAAAPPALSAAADPMGEPASQHQVKFGNETWQLTCRSVVAQDEAILGPLRADCHQLVAKAAVPADALGAAERGLLEQVANQRPALVEGDAELFELGGPFPMVVGTRPVAPKPESRGQQLAACPRRVVIWGVAIPGADRRWTLYSFHCADPACGAFPGQSDVPMPLGAGHVLSMIAGGGTVVCFRGPGTAASWKRHFNEWFRQRGLVAQGDWIEVGTSWHLRAFGQSARQQATGWDVQFGPDRDGTLTGLLVMTPVSPKREKDTRR